MGVAELLVQRQRLLAAGDRLRVVTQFGLAPGDLVEDVGLAPQVAAHPEESQGILGVRHRLRVLTASLPQVGQHGVDVRLRHRLTNPGGQLKGPAQVRLALVEPTQPQVRAPEVAVRQRLADRFVRLCGRVHGDPRGTKPVVPVAAAVQVDAQVAGQLPGGHRQPVGRGVLDRRHEHGMLCREPVESRGVVGRSLRNDAGPW